MIAMTPTTAPQRPSKKPRETENDQKYNTRVMGKRWRTFVSDQLPEQRMTGNSEEKAVKNIPSVMMTAPANAFPSPPSTNPPCVKIRVSWWVREVQSVVVWWNTVNGFLWLDLIVSKSGREREREGQEYIQAHRAKPRVLNYRLSTFHICQNPQHRDLVTSSRCEHYRQD